MATITVEVKGLRELGERMRSLAQEVNLKIARSATNAGAQLVKKQAIANAPAWPVAHMLEGVLVPPGNLKKNIIVKRIAKSALTSEHIVTVRGKRKDAFAARYGRLVEFGTVKMAPESFLRAAFEQEKGFAVGAIKDKLSDGIDKAMKAKG